MPEEIEKESREPFIKPEEAAGKKIHEEKEESATDATARKMGAFSSVEGVMMMFSAILLDAAGLFLLCFGLDDFGVLDIVGILLIGGWMYTRKRTVAVPQRAQKRAQGWLRKFFRGKGGWQKYLVPIAGEVIPYIGGLAFCWTFAVYFELTS